MQEHNHKQKTKKTSAPSLLNLMFRYKGIIILLIALTIIANALSISVPQIISRAIDSCASGTFVIESLIIGFSMVAFLIFIFTYLQNVVQVYASERVGLFSFCVMIMLINHY